MLFAILLGITFLFFLTAALLVFFGLRETTLSGWEKLPRNRPVGGILGLLSLLAFIPNVRPLFSPEDYLAALILAAFILAGLCYAYLDYLFARAFAGALILLAHASMIESFGAGLPGSGFFALMSLTGGTFGIFIAAKPHWLRDLFRLLARSAAWRLAVSLFCAAWSVSALILLIPQVGRLLR